MKQLKKTILTLVALLAVTTGAWADGIDIKFAANGKEKVVTVESLPHTFWCSNDNASAELDLILQELYDWPNDGGEDYYCSVHEPYPSASGNDKVTAGIYNGSDHYVTIAEGFEGSATVTGKYKIKGGLATYELVISLAEPTLTVAWNKTSKTGTFTMPGGNVELEPEYYPQAALTAVPTAINDVPATTDGAIVNAGTVANIDGTTTAQGTVMYYAVQSATAPTAPEYDDTGWTDKVPTATDFVEGNVYVWYYVKGADGDETSTFNDGAITKLGESGYITLLAAPTYAVTFAEGVNPEPPAEPEWTASPNTDVTKGQTVTVTYTGSKKVLGVKAEKKSTAPAVKAATEATAEDKGKLIGTDGNIYADVAAATAAGTTAVAKIIYIGTTGHATYSHGLALALTDEGQMAWGAAMTACNTTKNTSTPVTGATWLLASKEQWDYMLGTNGAGSYTALRDGFSGISGASNLQSGFYWSSTMYGSDNAWDYYFVNGSWYDRNKFNANQVRACLAF